MHTNALIHHLWITAFLALIIGSISACTPVNATPEPAPPGSSACLPAEALIGKPLSGLRSSGQTCMQHKDTQLIFGPVDFDQIEDSARNLLQDPTLELSFAGINFEPNSPETDLEMVQFTDQQGKIFSFELRRLELVVVAPPNAVPTPGLEQRSVDELRGIAVGLAETHAPQVLRDNDQWQYEEGAKPPMFFFQWSKTVQSQGNAPVNPERFQVGLLSDGTLVTYFNYAGTTEP
jgi:hypothetical protein